MPKIAGCTVFFNPGQDAIVNIKSYYDELDVLIVMDNSPHPDIHQISEIKRLSSKIKYHWLGKNEGIAKALNEGCRMALELEYNWILTMDQDSQFKNGDLISMLEGIDRVQNDFGQVGILSASHLVYESPVSKPGQRFIEVKGTMTSGNLLNLEAYRKTGPFEEKLFIDYVDYEYCLRLRKNGFHIIQDTQVWLEHSLGNFEMRSVFGRRMGASHHSPGRRYYITRNRIYTMKKYSGFDRGFFFRGIKNLTYDFFRILFFEQDKLLKIKAVLTGLRHAAIDRYGKFDGFDKPAKQAKVP